ncbi:hypothetical protein CLU79DRAFT_730187 [Phycomyces nitens]|nr:hypothetical protein CLU79DRAFT_730187 [Phycomyces nitens]
MTIKSGFPLGYFYVISKMNNLAMDIRDPTVIPGTRAKIVMMPKKTTAIEKDSQLWIHQDGFLTNKMTGLVLDINIAESFLAVFTGECRMYLDNMKEKEAANDQRFGYDAEAGYIYTLSDPNMVLDIRHEENIPDARLMIYKRKPVENASNQLWSIELSDPPRKVDPDDKSEDDSKRARMRAWFGNWGGWGDHKKALLIEEDLHEAHKKIYKEKKFKTSYELLAGAAAFEAVNSWEKKQKEEGNEVHSKLAKQLIASVAAAELVKLFNERGSVDDKNDDKSKMEAKKTLMKRMAMAAAINYFESKHGT